MNRVVLSQVPAMPWKNGGGLTRELLAWPQPQDWRVRLSVAEVAADGPFSAYPGVTRWFAVLDGAGVDLQVGGVSNRLVTGSAPLCFDGAAAAHCRLLDGPTQDFNLMLRGASGRLRRVDARLERRVDAPALIAVYAHAERAAARFGTQEVVLEPGTLLWDVQDPGSAWEVPSAGALCVEVPL